MARRNNNTLLFLLIAIAVVFGMCYMMFGKRSEKYSPSTAAAPNSTSFPQPDVQFLEQPDEDEGDFDMLPPPDLGMGEGLYGQMRHSAEM